MECPSDEVMQAFVAGALPADQLAELDAHLATCSTCAALVGQLASSSGSTGDRETRPGRHLEPGVMVGRYRVLERAGAGGMGEVYAAHDPQLDRRVALKLLRRGGADIEQRLLREAKVMARVDHAHVVAVHDVGMHDEQPFVVMAFIAGKTLRAWLEEPRSWRDILGIFRGCGEGLAAAHAAGVIHRDFKPDNVLVDEAGNAKVTDFGLALASETERAGRPVVLGTPAYMAPEQATASTTVDARADVFAFCCALWEALYGQPPFATTTLAGRLAAIERGDLRMPASDRGVPRRIREALEAGLRAKPEARPASMRQLLGRLRTDRTRARDLALVGGAVGLVAVGAIAWRASTSTPATWEAEIEEMRPSYEENSDALAVSPDGRQIVFPSDRGQDGSKVRIFVGASHGGPSQPLSPAGEVALYPRWARDGTSVFYIAVGTWEAKRIDVASRAVTSLGLGVHDVEDCGAAGIVVNYMSAPDCPTCQRFVLRPPGGGAERELVRTGPGEWLLDPRCDPTGTQLVYGLSPGGRGNIRPPSDLWVIAVAGGAPRQVTHEPAFQNRYPIWAPDGETVIYSSRRNERTNLWEIPSAGGTVRQLTFGEGPDFGGDITPDGRTLIYDRDVTSTPIIAVDGSGTRRRITHTLEQYIDPQVFPDGRELLAIVTRGTRRSVVVIAVETAEERELGDAVVAAISNAGTEIVLVPSESPQRLVAVPRGGGARRAIADMPGAIDMLYLGPGDVIHARVRRGNALEAWSVPLAGGTPAREAPVPWCMVLPAPRGPRIAALQCSTIHLDAHLVDAGQDLGKARRIFTARQLAWSPDGSTLVYNDARNIHRYAVDSGTDTVVGDGFAQGVAMSPDGKTVYATAIFGHVRRQRIVNFADRPRL